MERNPFNICIFIFKLWWELWISIFTVSLASPRALLKNIYLWKFFYIVSLNYLFISTHQSSNHIKLTYQRRRRADRKTAEKKEPTIPPGPVQLPSVVKLLPIPRGVPVKLPLEIAGLLILPTVVVVVGVELVVPFPAAAAAAVDG